MGLLSLDQALDAPDVQYHVESVPEWPDGDGQPGQVRFASLTADLVPLPEEAAQPYGLWVLAHSFVDDAGARTCQPDTVARLAKKNRAVVQRLVRVVMHLNHLDEPPGDAKNASGETAVAVSPTA